MIDGFGVSGAALAAHAGDVDALVVRMRNAAEAGSPLDLAAYGVVGLAFGAVALGASRLAADSVRVLAGATESFGAAVRSSGEVYARTEDTTVARFGGPR